MHESDRLFHLRVRKQPISVLYKISAGICSRGSRFNNTSRRPITPTVVRREASVASVKFGSCASLYWSLTHCERIC
ncbi:MAG: hypothetical protein AVDCRST_MAG37-823 [uncultured Rubrobacteraceae bacterium]|uniref:Uncharacterized protein n=1 Tax=uncultured Rubrobacteraceae bacterium TaxID=349277 RepID=A0A6J4QAI1_9ACTN|nr:MAG: hypothetical protein AVDCRST_MAG37-823 [uncultured Rubrobacteraceae bacterium]